MHKEHTSYYNGYFLETTTEILYAGLNLCFRQLIRQEYTLDGTSVYQRALYTHTHTRTVYSLTPNSQVSF